jgi:hypothetical protein
MPPAHRQLFRLLSLSLVSLAVAGCTPPDDPTATLATSFTTLPTTTLTTMDPTDTDETGTTASMDTSTTDPTMTDTDPTMTDTDPTATDTDPTDTDPTATDTDPTATDTDPTDTADGCSDADSGNEPPDDDGVFAAANQNTPHGNFVPQDDLGNPSECDTFMQDCPNGEKCVPYSNNGGNWNANKCVPILGNGMVGDQCTWAGIIEATDDCGADSACWDVQDVNGQLVGTCTAFCTGTPQAPMCPPGTSCLQSGDGSIALCIDTCNPLTQECPPGEACFWANSEFNCIFTTQDIQVGEPCGFINDCAEGLICLTASVLPNCAGAACCGQFCDLDCGPNSCSQPGTACTPFFEMGMAPFGNADVGVCILP